MNNLIKEKTFFKTTSGTSVDIMLTNRPRSVHKAGIIKTGFRDHRKLILNFFNLFLKTTTEKHNRNDKKFDKNEFLFELDQKLLKGEMYSTHNGMFTKFTNVFKSTLDKHTSSVTKIQKKIKLLSRRKHKAQDHNNYLSNLCYTF